MAVRTVAPSAEIAEILDSPEVASLIHELDALRWTGRKGYGARALVGACLVKSLYAIPTWTRVASLIAEHAALQVSIGGAPSQWAMYRFATKLREQKPLLDTCLNRVEDDLRVARTFAFEFQERHRCLDADHCSFLPPFRAQDRAVELRAHPGRRYPRTTGGRATRASTHAVTRLKLD